jgi:hypothetical protein
LGDTWFDKLDAGKAGKISQDEFSERVSEVLSPPPGSGPPAGPGGGFGGPFRPGRFIGPGLFTAADSNKDNSLSREEWKATFAKWSSDWDADKDAAPNNDELRNGLAAALPRPQLRARHADRRRQGVPELPRHVVADERRRRRRVPKAAGPAARGRACARSPSSGGRTC